MNRIVLRNQLYATAIRLVVLVVLVGALAGCGKRGMPQPPPDQPNVYPRTYPSV
jgi:predicted small lipoprotein YifL